jgi:hypothetical protein
MLREIAGIAKNASLTGALAGSASLAVQQYNRTLENLVRSGRVPEGWFQTLSESSTLDEVGFMAIQLNSYLEAEAEKAKDNEAAQQHDAQTMAKFSSQRDTNDPMLIKHIVGLAPFVEQAQLAELLRAYFRDHQTIDPGSLVGLAPFIGKEELSRIIREHLLGRPHQEIASSVEEAQHREPAETSATGTDNSATSLAIQLQDIARQLQDSELSSERRAALAEQLARLSHEQSSQGAEATGNNKQTRPL